MEQVNTRASRRRDLFKVQKGKVVQDKAKGKGKYKSMTAKSMLDVTFFL